MYNIFGEDNKKIMLNRDKLKVIVKNLELLVDGLKAEIYSDETAYKYEQIASHIGDLDDYDEVFEDDDD